SSLAGTQWRSQHSGQSCSGPLIDWQERQWFNGLPHWGVNGQQLGAGSMATLDVSPMISALRNNPNSFEFTGGSLHHIPSRHTFKFARKGHVHLDAECGCSLLAVSNDQESALVEAF